MTKQTKWKIVINEINKVCSESQVRKHAKMEGERPITLNCVIITALVFPCAVISVVIAVICVVTTLLCVVEKLCARFQRKLDLFNAIYEENKTPFWDEGGLFMAFFKGEDVHGRNKKKNNPRSKTENRKKTTTTTRICSENGMTSTAKRPWIGSFFSRNLIHQRPCASLRISSGVTGKSTLTRVNYKNQDYTKTDVSIYPVTNDNPKGADQVQAANGSEDHSHPLYVTNASLEENLYGGTKVPSSQVTALPQNSANKTGSVNINQESGRSSFRVEKRKKRSKAASVGCLSKVGGDHTKKLSSQESESDSFNVNKRKNSTKTTGVDYSNHSGVDKKVSDPAEEIERSSRAISKRKNRNKPGSIACSKKIDVDTNAAYQQIERSSLDVLNEQQSIKASIVNCSNKVSADKKAEATQKIGRSSTAKKEKKRSKPTSVDCSNQTAASEFQAKKPRKERVAVQHRRETSVLARLRKIIKEKASHNGPHSRTRTITRQRKLKEVELRNKTRFVGQPELSKVANQGPPKEMAIPFEGLLNANLPLQSLDKESASGQNLLGEVMDAKRPLPVTPFTVEPAAESMETDQELLPTTPSMTELVSLMEQLTIPPCEDQDYDVPLISDYDSDDESDAEYDLFPELQSLPEQVLQLIQLLA